MKFNKWTLGLAAVGAVSMASAVRADEAPKMSMVNTALSSTTLSGYVDTGVQYIPGDQDGGHLPVGVPNIDGFSLNDVDIALDKPLDATAWSAGYHVELNVGADAVGENVFGSPSLAYGAGSFGGDGTFAGIRQAYITLNTPLGSGITWKAGIMDDIIGYEGNTDGSNPNYTRSYGYSVEPTTMLGLTGTYQFCSAIGLTAGVVNAQTGSGSLGDKDYVAALNLTAPDSWGFLKGGTATVGVFQNYSKFGVQNYYAGITIPTPVSILKVGAAFDYVASNNKDTPAGGPKNDSGYVGGLYATIAPTDKLSFNFRGEYFNLSGYLPYSSPTYPYPTTPGRGEELTATVQYNLWANVISRAEVRWDHVEQGEAFGSYNYNFGEGDSLKGTSYQNDFTLAINLIYTF